MSFIIKNKEVTGEVINTDVEYTFKDGTKLDVRVSHFSPQNKQEIMENIKNRGISEKARITAEARNKVLIAQLTDAVVEDVT